MDDALIYYMDNAATAWPKLDSVYRFMEAGSLLDRLRLRLTRFFSGDEDAPAIRLCFGYNVTDALNRIINGSLASGDHVVTANLEHNSVIRPINHLVRDAGVEATFLCSPLTS